MDYSFIFCFLPLVEEGIFYAFWVIWGEIGIYVDLRGLIPKYWSIQGYIYHVDIPGELFL